MNNSKLVFDSLSPETEREQVVDRFRDQEPKTVKALEAIRELKKTKAWSSLKEEVFDGLTESLRGQILLEGKKPNPDTNKLNRLSGELKWAERFSDLDQWENQLRVELQAIRLKLHGTPEKNG